MSIASDKSVHHYESDLERFLNESFGLHEALDKERNWVVLNCFGHVRAVSTEQVIHSPMQVG